MKSVSFASISLLVASVTTLCDAFSLSMVSENPSRRSFMRTAASSAAVVIASSVLQPTEPANAAPTIYNLDSGIKYAVLKDSSKGFPQEGDLVVIEYTGYLTNGVIFDATHSEGKSNALLFKLGNKGAVIDGINVMVSEMKVGQKVQAIIPPSLAFGDKGICLEDGECLVKPGSTLVYDISLKKTSIPPP
jgi:FKBP-type peptidyl-prolyl cis-trans isomerase